MSNQEFQPELDDELISAYLDDELSAEERAMVEARLTSNAEAQQLLHQLRSASESVQRLPLATVGRDLQAEVLDRIGGNRQGSTDRRADALEAAPTISILRTRRSWIWASLAVAAGLLIMITQPGDDGDKQNLAAVGRHGDETSSVGREMEGIKAPAAGQVANSPSPLSETLANQPMLRATDDSGQAAVSGVPAQSSNSVSLGAPMAKPAAGSAEFLGRAEQQPPATELAREAIVPPPMVAARSADKTSDSPAPAAPAPQAVANSEARRTGSQLEIAESPKGGVVEKSTTPGGSFGVMSAPATAAAPAAPEVQGGGIANGSAGEVMSRGMRVRATPNDGAFKGGGSQEAAAGRAPGGEALADWERGDAPLVVEVSATSQAYQSQQFESLLAGSGITLELISPEKQAESATLGDAVRPRDGQERLSEKGIQSQADGVSLVAVEAPRATIVKFVSDLKQSSNDFTHVDVRLWDDATTGAAPSLGFKTKVEAGFEASSRERRDSSIAKRPDGSSIDLNWERYFLFYSQKDADRSAADDRSAESDRGRNVGTVAETGGLVAEEEKRRELSSPPSRGWARRVPPLAETGSRAGGTAGSGPTAVDSAQPAAARPAKPKMEVTPADRSGDNDTLRVLFVISREAGATPSAPAEKAAE